MSDQSPPQSRSASAPLLEVFRSRQGEGKYAGESQVFVRFGGCPLRCLYCDTPESWEAGPEYAVLRGEEKRTGANPVSPGMVLSLVEEVEGGRKPHTVSLTGGEPLLYPAFLGELAPLLGDSGRRVHLETAGVHPAALQEVLDHVDHVSMDWKIPSTLEKGDFRAAQKKFLAVAKTHQDVAVKIVLTPEVSLEETAEACAAIAEQDPHLLTYLQPVTPFGKVGSSPSPEDVEGHLEEASRFLSKLRVLPQLHPLWGIK